MYIMYILVLSSRQSSLSSSRGRKGCRNRHAGELQSVGKWVGQWVGQVVSWSMDWSVSWEGQCHGLVDHWVNQGQ